MNTFGQPLDKRPNLVPHPAVGGQPLLLRGRGGRQRGGSSNPTWIIFARPGNTGQLSRARSQTVTT